MDDGAPIGTVTLGRSAGGDLEVTMVAKGAEFGEALQSLVPEAVLVTDPPAHAWFELSGDQLTGVYDYGNKTVYSVEEYAGILREQSVLHAGETFDPNDPEVGGGGYLFGMGADMLYVPLMISIGGLIIVVVSGVLLFLNRKRRRRS